MLNNTKNITLYYMQVQNFNWCYLCIKDSGTRTFYTSHYIKIKYKIDENKGHISLAFTITFSVIYPEAAAHSHNHLDPLISAPG